MLNVARYLFPGFTASLLFLLISEIGFRIRDERITWFHRIMVLITALYLTAVFTLTVSPGSAISIPQLGDGINLIPFKVLDTAFSNPLNFWGNMILFVPFGVFLVLLFNRGQKLVTVLLSGTALSFLIELLQLFGIRSTDIDDIILNTVGTFFGYLIGKALLFFSPMLRKKVGIFKKKDGKWIRKYHDAGSIAVLTVFVLISVFITGVVKNNEELQNPGASGGDTVISVQPSEIPEAQKISVDLNAQNAYLWNISSNTVLYEKESEEQIAPASTAKMLTALTVLDYCDEDDKVLIGREVQRIAEDASRAWLYPGNELTIHQLLDALLLPSGNDAAYALAVFTGREICEDDYISIDEALTAFMTAMNKKAADLGAVHSNFITPDGYDAEGQYTTAQDLACIAKTFLKSVILRQIAGSYRASDVWLSGQEVTYYNTNELINPESPYYYECATGLKTGKSEKAGCCLVSSANIDKELYICVVMGSTEEGKWTDSLALYHAVHP